MSNLNTYIEIIDVCKKCEQRMLQATLNFCNSVTIATKEAFGKQGINPIKSLNVLDFNGLDETQTSQMIKEILSYQNGNDYPIWKSFVKAFIPEIANKVRVPIITAEVQHIDVLARERGQYTVIIENKLKGAVFQRNQLGRYIEKMRSEGYSLENIHLILLPGWIDTNFFSHIRKSAWCAPEDWMMNNNSRKCCDWDSSDQHACWCDKEGWNTANNEWCKECHQYRDLFINDERISVIDRKFPDWLISTASDDTVVPPNEIFLRSAMIQFADYINGLYNIRLNIQEVMERIKVLMQEMQLDPQTPEENYVKVSETLDDVKNLVQSLETMKSIMTIRIWQKEIETAFPDALIDKDDASFGILIHGVYCGIWVEGNRQFWGFYRNPNKIYTEEIEQMVTSILEMCPKCNSKGRKNDFIAWDYTTHGAERIADLLNAAEGLVYKYQRKNV